MPPVPTAGVPLNTPVVASKVTPVGSVPLVCVKVGAGNPLAPSEKDPAEPTAKVVAFALVKAAAWLTVRVKERVAGVPTPLLATTSKV